MPAKGARCLTWDCPRESQGRGGHGKRVVDAGQGRDHGEVRRTGARGRPREKGQVGGCWRRVCPVAGWGREGARRGAGDQSPGEEAGRVGAVSPFLRRVRTASGATAVQIAVKEGRRDKVAEHLGSAHDEAETLREANRSAPPCTGRGPDSRSNSALRGAGPTRRIACEIDEALTGSTGRPGPAHRRDHTPLHPTDPNSAPAGSRWTTTRDGRRRTRRCTPPPAFRAASTISKGTTWVNSPR